MKRVTGMSINASTNDGHPNGDYKALRYGKIVDDTPTTAGVYRQGELVFYISNTSGWTGWLFGFRYIGRRPVDR
ncbi:hypothetical protein [Streptomyces sp. NPDC086989]|uniref:hypothetical protein n=1 Tax=Streptomyces sp. NPDC086989 TaxID=3365764 RepID=UPI00382E586F